MFVVLKEKTIVYVHNFIGRTLGQAGHDITSPSLAGSFIVRKISL